METRQQKAIRLTLAELNAMDTPTLGAVAQALGTSGKTYDGREDVLARIVAQQKLLRSL